MHSVKAENISWVFMPINLNLFNLWEGGSCIFLKDNWKKESCFSEETTETTIILKHTFKNTLKFLKFTICFYSLKFKTRCSSSVKWMKREDFNTFIFLSAEYTAYSDLKCVNVAHA